MRENNTYIATAIKLLFCLILVGLAGCSSVNRGKFNSYPSGRDSAPLDQNIDADRIPDAVPQVEPLSRYGNPRSYVVDGYRYHVLASARGYNQVGYASWYGTKFQNQLTSTRERYSLYSMTAASTILPLPTYARVTDLANGRSVIVKVNDRGPFRSNRIMDLSYAAAKKLGYANRGTALVRVTAIDPVQWLAEHNRRRHTELAQNDAPSVMPEYSGSAYQRSPSTHEQAMYLQVGAYSNRLTASRLATRLAELTHTNAFVKPGYRYKTLVYRVHLGPVISMADYEKVRRQLNEAGFQHVIVIRS